MPSPVIYHSVERVRMIYNQPTREIFAFIRLVGQQESGYIATGIMCSHSDYRARNQGAHTPAVQQLIREMIDWERSILTAARLLSEAGKPVTVEGLLGTRVVLPRPDLIKVAQSVQLLSVRFSFSKLRQGANELGNVGVIIRIGGRVNPHPFLLGVRCTLRDWRLYQRADPKAAQLIQSLNCWQQAIQTATQALLTEGVKTSPYLIHERAFSLLKLK